MVLMSFPLLLPLWGGTGKMWGPQHGGSGCPGISAGPQVVPPPPFSGGDSPLPGQVGSSCPAQGRARG